MVAFKQLPNKWDVEKKAVNPPIGIHFDHFKKDKGESNVFFTLSLQVSINLIYAQANLGIGDEPVWSKNLCINVHQKVRHEIMNKILVIRAD